MKTLSHGGSLRTIGSQKRFLITRAFLTCLAVVAFCGTALSVSIVGPTGDAQKAFDDWKAANEAVAAAKKKLATANKELQTAITIITQKGGKQTIDQEAQLERLRAERAAAEAALKEAEAKLLAARIALEKAIAELEADDPLRKELMRKRDGYVAAQAAPVGQASMTTQDGLHKVTFDTLQGRVIVNLPDDMRAGDTISGTVVAEPKGNTKEERERNLEELQGLVLAIKDFSFGVENPTTIGPATGGAGAGQLSPVISRIPVATDKPFTFKVPPLTSVSGGSSPGLGITLNNTSGSPMISGTVPVNLTPNTSQPLRPPTPNAFHLPTIGQQGRTIEITGPFDGNSSNTTLTSSASRTSVQDFEKNIENVSGGFGLIAESPGKAVFGAPTNFTGPVELTLKDGNVETKGPYRNVGVRLSAPKTNLLRGERTTLTVQVSGLEGIQKDVPLQLDSTGVITMDGGNFQNLRITRTEVNTNGLYTTTRNITGVQPGAFNVTATVVVSTPPNQTQARPGQILLASPTPQPTPGPQPEVLPTPSPASGTGTTPQTKPGPVDGQVVHVEGTPGGGRDLWRVKVKLQSGISDVFIKADKRPALKFCDWIKIGTSHEEGVGSDQVDTYVDSYELTTDPEKEPPVERPKPGGDTKPEPPPTPEPAPEPPKPPENPPTTTPPTGGSGVTQPEPCKEGEKKTTQRIISCTVSDAAVTRAGQSPDSEDLLESFEKFLESLGAGQGVKIGKLLASAFPSVNATRFIYVKFKKKYVDETWVCKDGKWVLESSVPGESETDWIKLLNKQGGGVEHWMAGDSAADVEAALDAHKPAGCP